ncbi:MAG: anhydro-N-acetylmuramic acid kinase, partial [Planctomycetota bacterium]
MANRKSIIELNTAKKLRVAGLMSGTSGDGVDVAIVDIDDWSQKLLGFGTMPYPASLRKALFNLFEPDTSHVDDICHYNFAFGHFFASALESICSKTSIPLDSINLIGSHGQ